MLGRYFRSMPTSRMQVRMARPAQMNRSSKPSHQSFRLTKAGRKDLLKAAFGKGNYVPEAFQKALRRMKSSDVAKIKDKEVRKFFRGMKEDREYSREEAKTFTKGLLRTAHGEAEQIEKTKLREGLNPPGHEYEQSQRLVKEFQKEQEPKIPDHPMPDQTEAHRAALSQVRERLGIQHAPAQGTWQPQSEAPTPIGQPPATPPESKPGPVFNPTTAGFTGGRLTTHHGQSPAPAVPPPTPVTPIPASENPESVPLQPTSPDQSAEPPENKKNEVVLPDPNDAQDLPI